MTSKVGDSMEVFGGVESDAKKLGGGDVPIRDISGRALEQELNLASVQPYSPFAK